MLALVATSRILAILLPSLGIIIGVLQSALVGGLVRHALSTTPPPTKRWATDVAVGILVSAAYLTLRSFVAKLGAPGFSTIEPSLIALVVVVVARRRVVLREMKTAPHVLLAIVGLTLAWGHWFAFRVDPASSDPVVVSVMVDAARRAGEIATRLSPTIDTILAYPMGVQVLTLSLANPLLPTLSAVQVWPALTLSLTTLMIFEVVAPLLSLAWQRAVFFVASAGIRLGIGAFEVSDTWKYLEGASKKSLAFLLVLAAIYTVQALQERGRRRQLSLALALLACAFLFLVNPISFYLSVTSVVLILVASARDPKSVVVAAGVAAAFFAAAVVQDGYLTKNLGPRGPGCRIFASQVPWCTWDDAQRTAATRVETSVSKEKPTFAAALSELVTNPLNLLLPSELRPFRSAGAAITALLLACVGAGALWRTRRRAFLWAGGGGALLIMMIVLQTAIVVRTDQTMPYLIRGYTTTVYINLWQATCLTAVLGGIAALIASLPKKPAAGALLIVVMVSAFEIKTIGHEYGASVGGHIGASSPPLAGAFAAIRDAVRPGDRLLLPGDIAPHPYEVWYMPDFALSAMHFHTDALILGTFSYPGFWPSFMPSLAEHDRRMKDGDCAYMDSIGASVTVELGTRTPLPARLRECFNVERTLDDLRIYRRKPAQ